MAVYWKYSPFFPFSIFFLKEEQKKKGGSEKRTETIATDREPQEAPNCFLVFVTLGADDVWRSYNTTYRPILLGTRS
jgi:hypothetical protein